MLPHSMQKENYSLTNMANVTANPFCDAADELSFYLHMKQILSYLPLMSQSIITVAKITVSQPKNLGAREMAHKIKNDFIFLPGRVGTHL